MCTSFIVRVLLGAEQLLLIIPLMFIKYIIVKYKRNTLKEITSPGLYKYGNYFILLLMGKHESSSFVQLIRLTYIYTHWWTYSM